MINLELDTHNLKLASLVAISEFLASKGLYRPNNMLSVGTDSKTTKGEKLNYLTGILYLIPSSKLCPASRLAGCFEDCLVTAGRGRFNSVIAGRENKTAIFERFPNVFYELVRRSIKALANKAKRRGFDYCVRLNGTSDIDHTSLIASMPTVQFYDYTKRTQLLEKRTALALDNYHLTFSYSAANPSYKKHVYKAINLGYNIAVVFSDSNLPSQFEGLPVIVGDESDLRFLDYKLEPAQAIVGLYAKGRAKKSIGGFVVPTKGLNNLINAVGI